MPLIERSSYKPPFLLGWGHFQTVYPTKKRVVDKLDFKRERIRTPDEDFLDLDWVTNGNDRLVIISHGLEGNSSRSYVQGMAKESISEKYDVLCWNFRGCSGEPNKQLRSYHSGEITDLSQVIDHSINKNYKEIYLVGFSLGGNQMLFYLGSKAKEVPEQIKKAVVFSVPCHLKDGALEIGKWYNRFYMDRFLVMLRKNIIHKSKLYPEQVSEEGYKTIKNFRHFDDRYTAPINGYKDAEDYWEKCSSVYHINEIKIPTLMVSAKNDPFLTGRCYPVKECINSKTVYLEIPRSGGHCGFIEFNDSGEYWSERRALEFISNKLYE